jgi:hypothetical protein
LWRWIASAVNTPRLVLLAQQLDQEIESGREPGDRHRQEQDLPERLVPPGPRPVGLQRVEGVRPPRFAQGQRRPFRDLHFGRQEARDERQRLAGGRLHQRRQAVDHHLGFLVAGLRLEPQQRDRGLRT